MAVKCGFTRGCTQGVLEDLASRGVTLRWPVASPPAALRAHGAEVSDPTEGGDGGPVVARAAHAPDGSLAVIAMPEPIRGIVHIECGPATLEAALEAPAHAAGLVLFAHGSGSSRMSPRNRFVAGELRRAGFATLLVDLLTEEEDNDVERRFDIGLLVDRLAACVRWIDANPRAAPLPLGLFGASTGAAAAIELGAALGDRVAAIVSRGGRPDLASVRSLERVGAPTLLIVGSADPEVLSLNELAYERLRCAKSLRVVPGATHLFPEPGALESVAALAREWFGRYLASAPAAVLRLHSN